ncbi:MAG: response regulator transcription factor [Alphaproteobacteria bacterium]|nr:response regulator transcription factor [Alphaproteobacteria bacterium]
MADRRRILIADDHPMMRAALAQALGQALPDRHLVEAASLDAAIAAIRADPALDLILLDLNMPGMNGFSGLLLLRAEFPAVPVVIVSASEDAATVSRALDCGASGFIPKSAPSERFAEAIQAVLAGDLWFPTDLETVADDDIAARLASLTPQQLKVLLMLTEGRLNKQIAHEMQVTEATVKAHVTMILRKLGVASRTQAVIAARRLTVEAPEGAAAPVSSTSTTAPRAAADQPESGAPAARAARPA